MRDRASPPILIRRAPGAAAEADRPDLAPGLRAALARLDQWITLVDLFAEAASEGGPVAAAELQRLLVACAAAGWVEEGLGEAAAPALTCRIVPGSGLGPMLETASPAVEAGPLVFAAHCTITPAADGWRIGSPLATGEATVRDPDLLAALGRAVRGWTPEGARDRAAARLLGKAGLLRPDAPPPPGTPLATHELWLHALSRRGSAAGPVGATGRAPVGRAAPALRPAAAAAPVALPVPSRRAKGPRFAAVMGGRRSWRETPPGESLPAGELGALFWQAARDRAPPRRDDEGFERLSRPAPSAGGAHAADLFLALNPAPAGLPAFARYDAARHALVPVAADPARLLREAAASMGQSGGPAGLIILSARFARLTWKYGDASYALILKDAGVVLQTLHLAATALGRGSCILGGGNSRVFADLTGLDPLNDGPVGEIALTGRLPAAAAEEEAEDDG
jgi:SagB-type dehydrogenase family enzyme